MIEFSVCGGEIGPLSMSTDLGHRHPDLNHAAEALRVLCWQNILGSTPASAIMLVLHRARVYEDKDLCGFLS